MSSTRFIYCLALSLSLAACTPQAAPPTAATTSPSARPSASSPGPSPVPSQTPQAPASPGPSTGPGPVASPTPTGGSATAAPHPSLAVVALKIDSSALLSYSALPRQLKALLLDATGQPLNLSEVKLIWSSSNPALLQISEDGLLTMLKESGSATISVRLVGTAISASQSFSVSKTSGGGGGGGGGSGGSDDEGEEALTVDADVTGPGLGEFDISSNSASFSPKVALRDDGSMIAVWFRDSRIYAQRFDAQGWPLGEELALSSESVQASFPEVAVADDGSAVAVWQQGSVSEIDIYARRIDADGDAVGAAFRVNQHTALSQRNASVAMQSDGDFIVAWTSGSNQDGNLDGVYARGFAAAGTALSNEFLVNQTTTGSQLSPDVALNDDDQVVISWTSDQLLSNDVFARRFNLAGSAVASEFRVNPASNDSQTDSAIAIDADGDFAVAWVDYSAGRDVYFRRFAADETPQTAVQANTLSEIADDTHNPQIGLAADGDLVLAWAGPADGDDEKYGVYLRRYAADGTPASSSEVEIQNDTDHDADEVSLSVNAEGEFLLGWIYTDSPDAQLVGRRFSTDGRSN